MQDSAWKKAIERYFSKFVYFFFEDIAREIDFESGYEFLDKELEKITKDANISKRFADVLVKVILKNGNEEWLLIHIEVQSYYEKDFAKRMFIYNYKIFDRYKKDVVSLAILTDNNKRFRPNIYKREFFGFKLNFEFPIVKLIDLEDKIDTKSKNPFEIITNTHIKELKTKNRVNDRLLAKITLVKNLYSVGLNREDILLLYELIDYIINLPIEKNLEFHKNITEYEEEKKMPYITTAERIGIEKGLQMGEQKWLQIGEQKGEQKGVLEAIELGLELKFGSQGVLFYPSIGKKVKDIEKLRAIKRAIVMANTLEEVKNLINSKL